MTTRNAWITVLVMVIALMVIQGCSGASCDPCSEEGKERNMKRYSRLVGGQKNYYCPPKATGMMTGTQFAYQSRDGSITLLYEDGSMETRDATVEITDFQDYFAIVAYVQAGRKGR